MFYFLSFDTCFLEQSKMVIFEKQYIFRYPVSEDSARKEKCCRPTVVPTLDRSLLTTDHRRTMSRSALQATEKPSPQSRRLTAIRRNSSRQSQPNSSPHWDRWSLVYLAAIIMPRLLPVNIFTRARLRVSFLEWPLVGRSKQAAFWWEMIASWSERHVDEQAAKANLGMEN